MKQENDTDGIEVHTVSQLIDRAEDLIKDDLQMMTADKEAIYLSDRPGKRKPWYTIEFHRCDTPAKINDWVVHLARKTWVTPRHLLLFIQAANRAHGFKKDRGMSEEIEPNGEDPNNWKTILALGAAFFLCLIGFAAILYVIAWAAK